MVTILHHLATMLTLAGFHYDNKQNFSEHYRGVRRKTIRTTLQIFKVLTIKNCSVLRRSDTTYVKRVMYHCFFFGTGKERYEAV